MQVSGHGGNLRQLARTAGKAEADILDFSANLNPLGPPEWLRALISSQVSSLVHYPDPDCAALVQAAAERYGVAPDEVIAGNGSTEILYLLPRVLDKQRAIIPIPCYSDYTRACVLAGVQVNKIGVRGDESEADRLKPELQPLARTKQPVGVQASACLHLDLAVPVVQLRGTHHSSLITHHPDLAPLAAQLRGDELVFIGQPNNPTGLACDPDALRALAAKHPNSVFVIDEAFADFVDGLDSLTRHRPANVVVLLSLTKIFAIPGLRLGCAVANCKIIQCLRELLPPWSVNSLAQAVGVAALRDRDYLRHTRLYVRQQREALAAELRPLEGLTVFPSQANFLLVRLDRKDLDAPALARRLLDDAIAIRVCDNFEGLDARYFRVAVRTGAENARLLDALSQILAPPTHSSLITHHSSRLCRTRAKALMFQGTSSNAGKSVLTAALCRILLQDGYRVAPFKAQNMSLNSFVTRDGREMGRAQVVQAQACRVEPDARMNPILLKPNSETGAQVIVMGRPVGNMSVADYIHFKPQAFETAKQAFDALAAENDAIVLEGAGSPGEVNLKHHDIVNMQMARHAGAPVLLVGDIDRGGVFASFVGTMEVLAEWERALVAGFVVNRFRGQESLLKDALDYTQRHTGRPVFGVVPNLTDLGLPEEDSVTFKSAAGDTGPRDGAVEIAVVDLPHISNFTDFDSLRIEPDVRVRIVRTAQDLGRPDVVILPGSKNVITDLAHLRESGLADAIAAMAHDTKTEIVGICGGYQMLGETIEDPHGIESSGRTIPGLGLLKLTTVMALEKTLVRASGKHAACGLAVRGYEIHHGRSSVSDSLQPTVMREDGEVIGAGLPNGLVWGTYLHGIFDADAFRRWFIDRLRARRGWPALGKVCAAYDLEPAFERLAAVVRKSLRVDEIYRLMGLR
ncbi:MAG: cobyric acid synthase [Verrucomicrobia bacterium]|nr:cobyric acid synthase [Verrucomicrobiota bacterium]